MPNLVPYFEALGFDPIIVEADDGAIAHAKLRGGDAMVSQGERR
jgi:hypothetical protein